MQTATYLIPVLTLLYVLIHPAVAHARPAPNPFRRDANPHRLIRSLLREAYWTTDHSFKTRNNRWIINRQLVSGKEGENERLNTIRQHG